MANTDAGSATEPTPDRLTAYVYLDTCSGKWFVANEKIETRTLHEYLVEVAIDPASLANLEPAVPAEPGVYRDRNGLAWELMANGTWYRMGAMPAYELSLVRASAPFTRLVSEREPIKFSGEELAYAWSLKEEEQGTRSKWMWHVAADYVNARLANMDRGDQ